MPITHNRIITSRRILIFIYLSKYTLWCSSTSFGSECCLTTTFIVIVIVIDIIVLFVNILHHFIYRFFFHPRIKIELLIWIIRIHWQLRSLHIGQVKRWLWIRISSTKPSNSKCWFFGLFYILTIFIFPILFHPTWLTCSESTSFTSQSIKFIFWNLESWLEFINISSISWRLECVNISLGSIMNWCK